MYGVPFQIPHPKFYFLTLNCFRDSVAYTVGTIAAGSAACQSLTCNSTERRPLKSLMTGRNATDRGPSTVDNSSAQSPPPNATPRKSGTVLLKPQRQVPAVANSFGRLGEANTRGAQQWSMIALAEGGQAFDLLDHVDGQTR